MARCTAAPVLITPENLIQPNRKATTVEVKIGIRDVAREVVLESEQTPAEVTAAFDAAISTGGLLRLVDEKGRLIVVPATAIGYLEIGAPETRRVGFGSA